MMLAGVPLRQPVAGIAMGLIEDGDRVAILSDILGSEDHNGDMDFKVAGTGVGITALQMDIKIKGVTRELLTRALEQARQGRIHILREMLKVVEEPAEDVSDFAPRMETIKIPADRIGFLIGPGGKNIRQLQSDYAVRISIVDEEGTVQIYGTEAAKVKACRDAISATMETPDIGSRYTGTVRNVRDFGAFIEILPGVEALCHISELGEGFIEQVTDVVNVGDELEVEVINVDDRGKIKVSRTAVTNPDSRGSGGGDRDRGERSERGGRGGRGGDDRPRRGGRGDRDEEERPRSRGRNRDEEERPRSRRSSRDDDDRPRGRGRDDDERSSGRGRDDEDRPRSRGRSRDVQQQIDRECRPRRGAEERAFGGKAPQRERAVEAGAPRRVIPVRRAEERARVERVVEPCVLHDDRDVVVQIRAAEGRQHHQAREQGDHPAVARRDRSR